MEKNQMSRFPWRMFGLEKKPVRKEIDNKTIKYRRMTALVVQYRDKAVSRPIEDRIATIDHHSIKSAGVEKMVTALHRSNGHLIAA